MTTFPILETLRAQGPHPDHRDNLMLFGRLVGAWDLEVRFFDDRGAVVFSGPGEWTFAWVLDGRAVQDVIVYGDPNDAGNTAPGRRRTGTTLRRYNPGRGDWTSVWVGATSGDVAVFRATPDGDGIRLDLTEEDGTLVRWRFVEMRSDAFRWLGEISTDGGRTWALDQEMMARRRL